MPIAVVVVRSWSSETSVCMPCFQLDHKPAGFRVKLSSARAYYNHAGVYMYVCSNTIVTVISLMHMGVMMSLHYDIITL